MVPQHETYKANFKSFKSLMETYKDLPDNKTMEDMSPEDQVKIKGFIEKKAYLPKLKKCKL